MLFQDFVRVCVSSNFYPAHLERISPGEIAANNHELLALAESRSVLFHIDDKFVVPPEGEIQIVIAQ